ncbi:hypothetical protein CALVIDRAFT_557801 [Calocera viscosa TUFC12733]|uniref:DUF7770 domain-containing protein n=1 Tax=Calocera viscosa (strain TUFC12733) TaxID=1330018 RepID=A0A167HYR7_CALVF|nr:hypothetical protein CALVIDRAFT_557801 [Calocera viscosa TUFC12733]
MPPQIQYGDGVNTILPLKCDRILVYCTYNGFNTNDKILPNRWHLSACGGDQSITIDCFPRNNRARKCVIVINADTPSLHTDPSVGCAISIPVQKSCSLQGVVNYVIERGRARYRFAASGRGTRHWIRTVVGDLEDGGYVARSAWETVDLTMMDVHWSPTAKAWCDVVCGNFYSIEVESDPE